MLCFDYSEAGARCATKNRESAVVFGASNCSRRFSFCWSIVGNSNNATFLVCLPYFTVSQRIEGFFFFFFQKVTHLSIVENSTQSPQAFLVSVWLYWTAKQQICFEMCLLVRMLQWSTWEMLINATSCRPVLPKRPRSGWPIIILISSWLSLVDLTCLFEDEDIYCWALGVFILFEWGN